MIYLDCPFNEKDECKELGGKWDPERKKWYIPDGTPSEKFEKWIVNISEAQLTEHEISKNIVDLSPSVLDFQLNKCHRCFFLSKKLGIQTNNFPPPVFNKLDLIQKDFFIDKDTSFISDMLPKGKFLKSDKLPSKVSSSILKDNKSRNFRLVGIPDLVIQFENEGYGIIDFKTTKISDQKAEFYKFQLEAYATIFENPGEANSIKTPLLKPVTKLAILQFDPNYIEKKNYDECYFNFNTRYVELKNRITKSLFERITLALDILIMDKPPELNENCNDCNFIKKQLDKVIK